jgi:hypothetical protein
MTDNNDNLSVLQIDLCGERLSHTAPILERSVLVAGTGITILCWSEFIILSLPPYPLGKIFEYVVLRRFTNSASSNVDTFIVHTTDFLVDAKAYVEEAIIRIENQRK